jgi:hypothetical protein
MRQCNGQLAPLAPPFAAASAECTLRPMQCERHPQTRSNCPHLKQTPPSHRRTDTLAAVPHLLHTTVLPPAMPETSSAIAMAPVHGHALGPNRASQPRVVTHGMQHLPCFSQMTEEAFTTTNQRAFADKSAQSALTNTLVSLASPTPQPLLRAASWRAPLTLARSATPRPSTTTAATDTP